MINREVIHQVNGQVYSYHEVKSSKVDEGIGLLRLFTKSYIEPTDSNSVEFYVDVFFHNWEPELLSDQERHLIDGEFKLPDEVLETIETPKSLKDDKRKLINNQRDLLEKAGFPYMGKMIDSDMQSVNRINTTFSAAMACLQLGQPFEVTWTCADNSTLVLDAQGMIGMPQALAAYGSVLHNRATYLKNQVEAITSTDIEEVKALLAAIPDS